MAQQLGSLINATQGVFNQVPSSDDSIPTELQEEEPIFEVDHSQEQDDARAEAKQAMKNIVLTIVPQKHRSNTLIKSKIEEDARQLGDLYYKQKMNNVVLETMMNQIAKGQVEPRMFEVYTKISHDGQNITKMITEFQNQARKYYVDTVADLDETERYEEQEMARSGMAIEAPQQQQIGVQQVGNRYTSGKELIKGVTNRKEELMKNKFLEKKKQEEQNAEEIG